MYKLSLFLPILILASLLTACTGNAAAQVNEAMPTSVPEKVEPTAIPEIVSRSPPASCPVTVPQNPAFAPPAPYDSLGFEGEFWFGSDSLWTALPQDGTWQSLPHNPKGYTQKIFWWSDKFSLPDELEPELAVTGKRLDAKALPLAASKATNAFASDIGTAMLTGVDVPTLGCWKITGKYKNAELSFVVWVAP